jgi:hypothetical protein
MSDYQLPVTNYIWSQVCCSPVHEISYNGQNGLNVFSGVTELRFKKLPVTNYQLQITSGHRFAAHRFTRLVTMGNGLNVFSGVTE